MQKDDIDTLFSSCLGAPEIPNFTAPVNWTRSANRAFDLRFDLHVTGPRWWGDFQSSVAWRKELPGLRCVSSQTQLSNKLRVSTDTEC